MNMGFIYMLNEERVKVMVKLATYEDGEGRSRMKIGKQKRKDYISMRMIMTGLLVTFAYIAIIGIYIYANSEMLLDSMYDLNLIILGGLLFIGYLGFMIFYLMIAYKVFTDRYKEARKSMKPYYLNLKRLNRLYKEELQNANHSNSREENAK